MDELGKQWYLAGSLLLQTGFLVAAVWAVRSILKGMRASQEQMGALLKLTLSGVNNGEEQLRAPARATPYLLDGWPEAAQNSAAQNATEDAAAVEGEQTPNEEYRRGVWSGLMAWLQTPMASSEIGAWRRMLRWLQAPAGN